MISCGENFKRGKYAQNNFRGKENYQINKKMQIKCKQYQSVVKHNEAGCNYLSLDIHPSNLRWGLKRLAK